MKHGGTDSRHIDLADKICTRTSGCQISSDCFYRRPFQYIDFAAGRGRGRGRGRGDDHDHDDRSGTDRDDDDDGRRQNATVASPSNCFSLGSR